jgi:phage-related protein (TIGR01555 family)
MTDAAPAATQIVGDTLKNLVSGLLTTKDKSTYNQMVLPTMDRTQLEAAYRGDWFARKMVDIPALDMTRQGRAWQAKNNQIELIEAEERRLCVMQKVCELETKARLYGGAVIVVGMKDRKHDEPLNYETVRKGDIQWLHVLNRYELDVGNLVRDVTSPFYGQPEKYMVQGATATTAVHPSRVIRRLGNRLPDERTATESGWGDSVLMAAWETVTNVAAASANVSALLHEAKNDIIKIKGLMQLVGTAEYKARVIERFELASLLKSNLSTTLMDADEEFERHSMNFASLHEIMKVFLLLGSGAADIPATRMIGQSAVGLNSTGEGDLRNYYDRLASEQYMGLGPAIAPLDELVIRSATGERDPNIHYIWNPLWQLTESEKADVALKKAQTFQIDVNSAVIPLDALGTARINQLIEDSTYPGIEDAIAQSESEPGPQAAASTDPADDPNANDDPNVIQFEERRRQMRDAAPRSLYIRRDVVNVKDFAEHYAAQGVTVQKGLHVTIAYSKQPVDWATVGEAYQQDEKGQVKLPPGGMRLHDRLGKDGAKDAVVLLFTSRDLTWRHKDIIDAGASWDFPDYQPHITIVWDEGQQVDIKTLKPYLGAIVLGPEVYEEVDEDWRDNKAAEDK